METDSPRKIDEMLKIWCNDCDQEPTDRLEIEDEFIQMGK